jgi:hypothetical protein
MPNLLGRYTDYVYAATRFVIGFLYACHGAQKLFGVLGAFRAYKYPFPLFSTPCSLFSKNTRVGVPASVWEPSLSSCYTDSYPPTKER